MSSRTRLGPKIIEDLLTDSHIGLASIKGEIEDIEAKLDDPAYGLAEIKAEIQAIQTLLQNVQTELNFEHQTDAILIQTNPVQNVWYTILGTTANVRIIGITASVATTGETIIGRITIDGVSINGGTAFTAGTVYTASMDASSLVPNSIVFGTRAADPLTVRSFLIEGRSVKVEIRKTTAAGNGTLSGKVIFAKR